VEKQKACPSGVPQVDQLCKLQAQVDQLCSLQSQVDQLFIHSNCHNNKFTTQITTNNSNYYKQLKITHKQQHLNIFNTTSSFKPSSIALVPNFLPLQAFKITIQSNPIMTTTARTSIPWQNFSFFFKSSSCFSFTLSFFLSSSILFINDKITSFARPEISSSYQLKKLHPFRSCN